MLVFLILALLCVLVICINPKTREGILGAINGDIKNANDETQTTEVLEDNSAELTDDSAIVSSVAIVNKVTGTGPFDENDEPGNDSSSTNNIVRSFDTITWEIEANMAVNNTGHGSDDANKYASFRGGVINIEASLPTENAGAMKWSLDDMKWAEGSGAVSDDGLTFTAQYKMSDEKITVPGKQTISLVLKVEGAANGTQLAPSFKVWMQGNETNSENEGYEVVEIVEDEAITVSAKGSFNIKFLKSSRATPKATVNFEDGAGEVTGRIYGYGAILQLYNEDKEKGLKGLEYPKGDITFDMQTKLEAVETIDGKQVTTDITDLATPRLWNYKINVGNVSENPAYGNIQDRNMYFGAYTSYDDGSMPYGILRAGRASDSIYNSGDILMQEDRNIIHTTINDYEFNGVFPIYNDYHDSATSIIYGENVGCFSAGYFQIFVPDNEETLKDNRTYYLTVEDKNMQVETVSNQKVTNQVITNDDTNRIQHFTLKPGGYNHSISIYNDQNKYIYETVLGKARISKGQNIQPYLYIAQNSDNDIGTEIKSVNKLVKFNGDGLEPILYEDGEKAHFSHDTMTWKIWYVTKKDGTNWVDETERNNANIEDLNMYENLEDIPEGYICIGMYFESQSGMIQREINFNIKIRLKIKETAKIGKTYGIMQDDDYWLETLDRTTQTATNPNAEYPRTVWSAHNQQYKQTQYDENGQIILGTHYVNSGWGNTVLILGADSSISVQAINPDTQQEKTVYDIGKNENIVTLKMTPTLTEIDPQVPTNIKGTTVRIKETLPKELTYIPGSSNYGEPIEKIEVEDGTTYIWEIYNCNVGEKIEDLVIKAEINPDTKNGTTLQVTSIIEPDKDIIGLSSIELRTDTRGIQIVNLSSHSLYKETEDRIIETNGEIKYKVTYQNKTDYSMPEFQLLDILPYNGDGRKTAYNGTYILENVNIVQTAEGSTTPNYNLTLYTTTDIEARKITPKDEGIGITEDQGGIWKEKEIGKAIDEPVTVLAVKGQISPNTKVEMEITLKTNNNRAEDIYSNSATAQTSKNTEVITSTNTETRVVRRQISGMIWYDTNENGIKDENESYANRVEVELKKSDGSKAVDINGNEVPNVLTDNNGKYEFNNLPRDEYIVQIQTAEIYTLTKANVGSNREINSKFVIGPNGEKQSYTITSLNGIQSPEITEKNVNAGLVVKDAKIIVKYLEEDKTPETDADNKLLKEQDEFTTYEKDGVQTKYKLGDTYNIEPAEITDYITLRNSGNTSGRLNEEVVVVTYYYTCNKQDINVQKVWNDNNDQAKKRPTSIKIKLKDGNTTVAEQVLSATNKTEDNENIWATTFTDITTYRENGEKITYSVDEEENEGTLDSYVKTLKGTTITNTFTQNTERTQVQVIKNWEDNDDYAGKRPDNLVLILKKEVSTEEGKTETQEVARATINAEDNKGSNNNEWVYTFTNLAKYDENNNEIKYVVEEEKPVFYEEYVQKTAENTYEITNTFAVPTETFDLEVTKIWNDNNNRAGKRPEKVTLVLTGKNARGEVITEEKKITLTSENKVGEDITEENVWKGTITGLPKYDLNADIINYELSEENLNNIFYTTENVTIDQQTKTVTNRFEVPDDKVEITVNKKWDDNNNELERRPEEVTLYLSGNNKEYDIKLTEANKTADESIWSGTISNLPKYDVNGDEITYTLDERPIANEFYTKTGIDQTAKTVINKFGIPTETIQVPVTKIWEDSNNKAGKRPENIVLQIKDKKTGEVELEQLVQGNKTTNDGWSYIFEVPKYNETGEEVEYEIGERNLNNKFYPEEVVEINQDSRTITNKFIVPDEKVAITVTKIWNDNNNSARKRPDSVNFIITGNGKIYEQELTKANASKDDTNKWVYTFNELPKYDENGNEITYTIDESDLNNKYYEKENVNQAEKTITNVSKYGKVTVHHYIEGTQTRVPDINGSEIADVIIEGVQGESYNTNTAENVQSNYELVSIPTNANGIITKEDTEVIYYYKLKEPSVTNSINKTGTDMIITTNQEVNYTISYKAEAIDYIGEAEVTIVDNLPYAIDEAKSDLAGGTYNGEARTITWTEKLASLNSYTNTGNVEITKNIKVVYVGLDLEKANVINDVTGSIKLLNPEKTSNEVTASWTTTTEFTMNIPVSKVWEDDSNKLNQRPTKVVFKLHGSDGSEYTLELSKPGTAGSTTTQDSTNPNKWNDIFENLPKYDSNNQEIVYTLTEEEKTEGDLKYYDSVVTDKAVTNTNKYGKVIVHHYIMNTDGSTTTTRVPDINGTEIPDVVIEGKEGDEYTTEKAKNINNKYELVKVVGQKAGTIEKYNEEKTQEVIYYYRLKPAKVLINYLEKDEDTDDSNNLVLTAQEQIDGHVDDSYNTDTDHRKETIEKDGKTYTLVSDSGNKTGNMTLQDITVTYYYLQNTKATVRYVERNPETHEIVKDLEEPYTQEGLVGDKFVTNEKAFIGYKLVEGPENKTITMTKEEKTLIYYYEPIYTGLIENHIDDRTGKVLETITHEIQIGEDYNIPSKDFEGYDLVESKLPENAEGTMGEELVTVNYYYIKKAVLEVNYLDVLTNEPLTEQVIDDTKHEGDEYTTEQKTFDNYDLVEVPSNATGTMIVETDEQGNITNNRTIVTYYYAKKSAGVEEHHIDILTGEDIEEPTLHEGHVGDEYDIPSKEFLSYQLIAEDEEGNSMLPENSKGTMTEEKIVVNYYYNQPAKVIVHYVEKATGKELEETNLETGELQNSQVLIEGQKDDDYTATAKEFEYYTLIEKPEEEQGKMKVEIVKDEEGNDVVNNTIELYYYYEAKPFNIGVDKEITGIIVNGERREPTNGKLEKVEIYRKSTESTSVQVEYKIKVSNTGEVSGNATIEENIPEGMSLANNDGTWEEQEGKLIKVIPELGAGETKEYTVLLNWEQTGENMGEKANEVKLVETGNVPGFVDNNDKDNTSNANVIISVETGELPIGLILALVALVGLETVTLRYAVVLTKRQKKK